MKRASISLFSLALGVVLTGAIRNSSVSAAPLPVRHSTIASGTLARALAAVVSPSTQANDDHSAAVLRRLRDAEPGTYIGDILAERDSSIARWADRQGKPLTVWIQPTSDVADFDPTYVAEVRSAFEQWDRLHLPVHFAFSADSADAEVHVTWIDRFTQPISGRTRWSRDDDWVITEASIVLAMHHMDGEKLDRESMNAMTLHEVGHLLGLDHTQDSSSIMAPRVRVRALSDADRATVRLVYALPIGPLPFSPLSPITR
jgi:predicted Zn-dependent protease